jgi:hypothetical protein
MLTLRFHNINHDHLRLLPDQPRNGACSIGIATSASAALQHTLHPRRYSVAYCHDDRSTCD